MEALLQLRHKPTAIVCFNDLTAIGAIFAAHRAGLDLPRDLSIAGVDNIRLSQFVHPLLEPRLIVRDSCAPAPS